MTEVVLVEVDVISPAGVAETLRFSDRAIAPMAPADPDLPNVQWEPRLVEAPTIRRSLFDDLATLSSGLGVGAMRLTNADRGLSAYQAYSWGEVRVWRWTEGADFATADLLLTGLASAPSYARKAPGYVSVSLYDYRAELEAQLQTVLFTGGNNGTTVLYEGEADGLKNTPRPLAFGRLEDAQLLAPQVNAGVQAHMLHDGPIQGSVQIFDRGYDADFAFQGALVGAAFDAFAPAPASYVVDLTRGLLKINGSAAGTLTFGCRGDAAGGYVETTGPILARLLAKAGVPSTRIGASVAALASSAPIGAWFGQGIAAREALAWVARSAPAALLPGRDGVWQALRFAPPAAVAEISIDEDDVIDIEADETAPEPVGEVRVGWGRIGQTFNGTDIAPVIRGTSEETRLASEYRWAVQEDAVAKARRPRTWRTLEITTALRLEADAQALAGDLKTLFGLRPDGAPRTMWRLTLEWTPARRAVQLGATVQLTYPTDDIDDRFILLAEEPMRPRRDQVVWTLWG